jgi:alanine-glyoxylate transaminase / serine-glyoxylate transaminase / serine-pyruvate transaminase
MVNAAARARFNAVSKKALTAHKAARLPRSYWDWEAMLETGRTGFFPYTPATNLLFGLREAPTMLLEEEGLSAVFEATRPAVAPGASKCCVPIRANIRTP